MYRRCLKPALELCGARRAQQHAAAEALLTVQVDVRAGDGGKGCASLWGSQAKGKMQPADGGSGGQGGDVIIEACQTTKSLRGLRHVQRAGRGGAGGKQKRAGTRGADLVLRVPVGTLVTRLAAPGAAVRSADTEHVPSPQQSLPHGPPSVALTGPQLGLGSQALAAPEHGRSPAERISVLHGLNRLAFADGEACQSAENGADAEAATAAPSRQHGAGLVAADEDEESTVLNCWPAAPAAGLWGQHAAAAARPEAQGQRAVAAVVADLVAPGQSVVAARGGMGGRGNALLARRGRGTLRAVEAGAPGERWHLQLEVKALADVGLVGAPNAGKSTLLRAISAARPKVAPYPFTTLQPQLGMVPGPRGERTVVADIPGLVPGAAANRGLGHAFLRHAERTSLLVLVVDLASGRGSAPKNGGEGCGGGRDGSEREKAGRAAQGLPPAEQLDMLQRELALYAAKLADIPAVVAANKADLLGPGAPAAVAALRAATHLPVHTVSALTGDGTPELLRCVRGCQPPSLASRHPARACLQLCLARLAGQG